MARSFRNAAAETFPAPLGEAWHHRASDTFYSLVRRNNGVLPAALANRFQRPAAQRRGTARRLRMGSGNHVRTYLHRTSRGVLIEVPLAWYAEQGGHWGV